MKTISSVVSLLCLATAAFAGDPDGGNWVHPIVQSFLYYFVEIARLVV
jgi:hypothetical protein